MAACPEETPKEPRKICAENTLNHERDINSCNELANLSKNHNNFSEGCSEEKSDVSTLSEDEFLQLMIEASTFNKSSSQESALLQRLRSDNPITDTEPIRLPPTPRTGSSRNHLPSSRTSDGRKKHTRNREGDSKGIHQSQSLQDLLATAAEESSGGSRHQRRRQAHRTHSLSSEDVDADSLALLKKLGKKSRGAKHDMCTNPPKADSTTEKNGASSPVEIEMEEIKSAAEESSVGKEGEPSSNGVASNSKFYVDCNDVDSTVSFPLKLVSSMEEQSGDGAGGDQLKRFPIVPWPRPLQVQSFFSSLPMDSDTFSASDKQILNADINGNPFSARNTRQSNLASFVSSTLMDYSGTNSIANAETKNRKNKRLRNTGNKGVLSENIAGHRGKDDIDSLLQFINSSDKKAKRGQPVDGKKPLVKNCPKSSVMGVVNKKDLKRSSSLENMSTSSNPLAEDVFLFEPRPEGTRDTVLDINSNEESQCDRVLDEKSTSESSLRNSSPEVSSFAQDFYSTADVSSQTQLEDSGFSVVVKKKQRKKHQGKLRSESYRWRNAQAQRKKGMMLPLADSKCGKQDARRKSTSSVPHSDHSSADNSDLDSVHSLPVRGSVPHPTQPHPHTTPSSSSSTPQASYADIARMPIAAVKPGQQDPQGKEMSPNPVCVKEGSSTKRRSGPSEGTRVPLVSAVERDAEMPSGIDVTISSGANKVCGADGKVPGSGIAVPGSSDIDTGSSVPGAGSKNPAPGVTVSSTCVTVPASNVTVQTSGTVISGSSSTVPVSGVTISSADVKVRSNPKSTREINTQTEPESVTVIEKSDVSSVKKCDEPSPRNECASCSLRKNLCACSKPATRLETASIKESPCGLCSSRKNCTCCKPAQAVRSKSLDIPPVIMDNMPSQSNPCDVSFGFGIEEVLDMAPTELGGAEGSELVASETDACSEPVRRPDLSTEQSSHLRRVCYGTTDKNLCYSETNVNVKKFNHSELTRFLGNEFYSIEKEINGMSGRRGRPRVKYYSDSSEEA